ncbi:hypothetical protein N7I24_003627 [Vibrio alginolyticus]|nr:hypothetical protein [Vibrio alginolyticus]
MSWKPIRDILFQHPDTATGLDYLCSFDLSDGQVLNGYTWEMTPETPPQFSISSSSSGVRLTSESLAGLFKPEFIDYREGDQIVRVGDWPELPPGKDLIEFRPSGQGVKEYTLTVTVSYIDTDPDTGQGVERTDNHSWRCLASHDYSSGRDKLLEYMNAGSN